MANKIDNKVFQAMLTSAEADVTALSLFPQGNSKNWSKMAAGFTPGMGNIADAADALLYTFEGDFGEAALSAASMIPILLEKRRIECKGNFKDSGMSNITVKN